jgi:hypothetical protein
MYRCEFCSAIVPPHTPSHRVIVETRPTVYSPRREVHVFQRKRKKQKRDDPGGRGIEIAREKVACPSCAAKQ